VISGSGVIRERRKAVAGKFVLKKDATGKFRFSLVAGNGQVIATSEAYESKEAALEGIESVERDAEELAVAVTQVEAGHGPVAVARPGHETVVLGSAQEWQRLDELESAESTAWWRQDAAERAAQGEEPSAGEEGPGLDEAEFRRRFAHLFHDDVA
jgi:uncharacterized protein YegP (UPF0339 family)